MNYIITNEQLSTIQTRLSRISDRHLPQAATEFAGAIALAGAAEDNDSSEDAVRDSINAGRQLGKIELEVSGIKESLGNLPEVCDLRK